MVGEATKFQLPDNVNVPVSVGTFLTRPKESPIPVFFSNIQATYPRTTQSIRGGKPPVLHIYVSLNVDRQTFLLKALVVTGAEVNIIRRGIIPTQLLRKAEITITLSTADSSAIQGGKLGVSGLANLRGHERDLKTHTDVQCPIHFY